MSSSNYISPPLNYNTLHKIILNLANGEGIDFKSNMAIPWNKLKAFMQVCNFRRTIRTVKYFAFELSNV